MTWENAWQEGRTPWDAGAPAPALLQLIGEDALGIGRALVPGCGRGYDVFALAEAGFDATGLEIAPSAAAEFEKARGERGGSLAIGDFFELETEPFDLVWDYTFLCALDPEMRSGWAKRQAELVRSGGLLGALLFPLVKVTTDREGPPFRLDPREVQTLLEDDFELLRLEAPATSHPGREGKEKLSLWRRR